MIIGGDTHPDGDRLLQACFGSLRKTGKDTAVLSVQPGIRPHEVADPLLSRNGFVILDPAHQHSKIGAPVRKHIGKDLGGLMV